MLRECSPAFECEAPSGATKRNASLRVVDNADDLSAPWHANLLALQQFVEATGHCHPPYRETVNGKNLYAWAAKQRQRRSRLSTTQQRALEALPGWSWNLDSTAWQASYEVVLQFVEREGHCAIARSHVESGVPIGRWLSGQRQRIHTMDASHRALLEALPGWTTESRKDRWWTVRAAAARYADIHGHTRVPYDTVFAGHRLGMWVARQRRTYRQGKLSTPRIEALEALPGWVWSAR